MIETLENIEVVEGTCSECVLWNYTSCDSIFYTLCGFGCGRHVPNKDIILKKKEVWVRCTKENTKVGDTIRGVYKPSLKVKYISNDAFYDHTEYNCLVEQCGKDRLTKLEWYEIKENN